MAGVASFHLVRFASATRPLAAQPAWRRRLARTDGLVFWRLLGTGRGSSTAAGVDLCRWALFAVWSDAAARARFAPPWGDEPLEGYEVGLAPLGGHGTWRRFDVLGALAPAPAGHAGPVAALTRADVRFVAWRRFHGAAASVSAAAQAAGGLLAVVGVGEAPVGRQATFSLWRSQADLEAFARGDAVHAAVVRRTRSQRWYGEELFARFAPSAPGGTWDGRDPLA